LLLLSASVSSSRLFLSSVMLVKRLPDELFQHVRILPESDADDHCSPRRPSVMRLPRGGIFRVCYFMTQDAGERRFVVQ